MDSTLLGALIGGGFAVAGSVCTAVAAYFTNKHGEHAKIKINKKEDLYISLIELRESIIGFRMVFNSPEVNKKSIIERKNEFDSSRKKSRMLIDLYFRQLENESKTLTSALAKFNSDFISENVISYLDNTFEKASGEDARKEALSEVNKMIRLVSRIKI